MSSLRSIELGLVDEIFRGDGKGYVLDFSNRTFAEFFIRELQIDNDADQYATDGVTKGRRLRCFLGQVDDATAARTLKSLWEYRQASLSNRSSDHMPRAAGQIASLIAKLEGTEVLTPVNVVPAPRLDKIDFARFRDRLLSVRRQL